MSTPLPDFKAGTKVYAQNAAGLNGPGWIFADGAAEGQSNITFLRNDTGAATVVSNAAYVAEGTAFTGGVAQFKLNFTNP